MLAFDARFVSGVAEDVLGCVLWADEPKFGRVRFQIGHRILQRVPLIVVHSRNA